MQDHDCVTDDTRVVGMDKTCQQQQQQQQHHHHHHQLVTSWAPGVCLSPSFCLSLSHQSVSTAWRTKLQTPNAKKSKKERKKKTNRALIMLKQSRKRAQPIPNNDYDHMNVMIILITVYAPLLHQESSTNNIPTHVNPTANSAPRPLKGQSPYNILRWTLNSNLKHRRRRVRGCGHCIRSVNVT